MNVIKLLEYLPRMETGSIQFGNDWPGIFLRGDEALQYAYHLQQFLDQQEQKENIDIISIMVLRRLVSTLQSCDLRYTK